MSSNPVNTVFEDAIKQRLENIWVRDINKTLVETDFLSNISFEGRLVKLVIDLPNNLEINQSALEEEIKKTLSDFAEVRTVFSRKLQKPVKQKHNLPNIKKIVLFSATKGGVGKSTSAVNSALALSKLGYSVGLLDADIYGPTIPQLLGVNLKPETVEGKMKPIKASGIYSMSLGYLVDEEQAAMWRGPMLSKVLYQLILGVEWPELDFLIVDMPPGTGDVYISLAENFVINGAVLVTTPQAIALNMLKKTLSFFKRMEIRLLGVLENMSCFYDAEGQRHDVFGISDKNVYKKLDINLLVQIPLSIKVAEFGRKEFNFEKEREFLPYIEVAQELLKI